MNQEAFEIELRRQNIPYEREKLLNIYYKGLKLKKYYEADFVCYDKIIIELKAITDLNNDHVAQTLNYLAITGFEVGLLFNFGKKSLQHKRLAFTEKFTGRQRTIR